MNSTTAPWEHQLIAWASQGMDAPRRLRREVDAVALAQAYAHCDAVTQAHSRTFHLASGLLPAAKRRAVRALYAFCRVSDDLVDAPSADPDTALADWRRRVHSDHPEHDGPVLLAWTDTQARYGIPALYVEQLLDGVARDLHQTRYATFDDLAAYSYGVASTVGLMAMHIVGFDGPAAIPFAVKLGVALQLTNILRDVGEDWARGRLYLPQDELAAHGLTEADLAAGQPDARWRALMRFQIARVRRLYAESLPGLRCLHRDGRFAIAAAAELYAAILDDIEAHGMDVFNRRAHTTAWGKLRRLPGVWWRANVAPARSHTTLAENLSTDGMDGTN